jgi:hypothetical protein
MQIPQKRVTKLIWHHKVAAFPPQPQVRRPLEAAVKGPRAFSSEVDPRFASRKRVKNKNLEL